MSTANPRWMRVIVALLLTGGAAAVVARAGEGRGRQVEVEVRATQGAAFQDVRFTVTLSTAGVHMTGAPTVRPYYGRATLVSDSVTNKGFAFTWDLVGAIRAARNDLRSTQINLHWTLMPEGPQAPREGIPMLTVVTVSVSAEGRAGVSEVVTSSRSAEIPVSPAPTATGPALEAPAVSAAITRLSVDEALHLEVWLPGATLTEAPETMATVGRAAARRIAGAADRVEVDWTPPAQGPREPPEVQLVVNWIGRTASGPHVGGRMVLTLAFARPKVGVTAIQSITRLVPSPAGAGS